MVDPPRRGPDESLWVMFESALPFRSTVWARETPLVEGDFLRLFEGTRTWFDPSGRDHASQRRGEKTCSGGHEPLAYSEL
jgi:hypothetical protein